MTTLDGSTPARRALGSYLGELRFRSRHPLADIADALGCSVATMYRYLNGVTPIKPQDARTLCNLLQVPEDISQAVIARATENLTKEGWWHHYLDAVPDQLNLYLSLEDVAERIRWYEQAFIPGLLQTPEYAQAVIQGYLPDISPEALKRKIELRMHRKRALTRGIWRLSVDIVIEEVAIRRPIGGPTVMAGQLALLREASEMPNVTLRILPTAIGIHRGLETRAFELLDFRKYASMRQEPTTVYFDGFLGGLYYDEAAHPESVAKYAAAFDQIAAAALSPDETRSLIEESERALRHGQLA